MQEESATVAVVGCGLLARGTHIVNIVESPTLRLHALCDTDDEALLAAKALAPHARITHDFHEIFADPAIDFVVLATTQHVRMPMYQAAIEHRKPVYSEKPLAATLAECREAAEAFTASGVPFCIGHNRRCSPAMVEARRIIQRHRANSNPCPWRFNRPGAETLDFQGQEHSATMLMRLNDDWHSWKPQHLASGTLAARYGGLFMEMTHFVDLAHYFLEVEAEEVVASCQGPLHYTAVVTFSDQSTATIVAGSNGTFGYPKELLEISANGGFLAVDHMVEIRTAGIPEAPAHLAFPLKRDDYPDAGRQGGLSGWLEKKAAACADAAASGDGHLQLVAALPDKGHRHMLHEFAREIRGERDPVSPAMAGYQAARVCLAAVRSVEERRTVNVSEMD